MTQSSSNTQIISLDRVVDTEGTWTLTGKMSYVDLHWNGLVFSVVNSGLCDYETDIVVVE